MAKVKELADKDTKRIGIKAYKSIQACKNK